MNTAIEIAVRQLPGVQQRVNEWAKDEFAESPQPPWTRYQAKRFEGQRCHLSALTIPGVSLSGVNCRDTADGQYAFAPLFFWPSWADSVTKLNRCVEIARYKCEALTRRQSKA